MTWRRRMTWTLAVLAGTAVGGVLWLLRLLLSLCPIDPAAVPFPRAFVHEGARRESSADRDKMNPPEQDEARPHLVDVGAFAMDPTEVTTAAYTACVLTGRCASASISWRDLWSAIPVTDVTWREASRYCVAVHGRLPTETEWERAAREVDDGRRFPWGDAADCSQANWGNYEGEGRCPANAGRPLAVGSHGARKGLHDMAGNVWEWTADYYGGGASVRATPSARGVEELGRAPRRSVRGHARPGPRLPGRAGPGGVGAERDDPPQPAIHARVVHLMRRVRALHVRKQVNTKVWGKNDRDEPGCDQRYRHHPEDTAGIFAHGGIGEADRQKTHRRHQCAGQHRSRGRHRDGRHQPAQSTAHRQVVCQPRHLHH